MAAMQIADTAYTISRLRGTGALYHALHASYEPGVSNPHKCTVVVHGHVDPTELKNALLLHGADTHGRIDDAVVEPKGTEADDDKPNVVDTSGDVHGVVFRDGAKKWALFKLRGTWPAETDKLLKYKWLLASDYGVDNAGNGKATFAVGSELARLLWTYVPATMWPRLSGDLPCRLSHCGSADEACFALRTFRGHWLVAEKPKPEETDKKAEPVVEDADGWTKVLAKGKGKGRGTGGL